MHALEGKETFFPLLTFKNLKENKQLELEVRPSGFKKLLICY